MSKKVTLAYSRATGEKWIWENISLKTAIDKLDIIHCDKDKYKRAKFYVASNDNNKSFFISYSLLQIQKYLNTVEIFLSEPILVYETNDLSDFFKTNKQQAIDNILSSVAAFKKKYGVCPIESGIITDDYQIDYFKLIKVI